MIYITDKYRKKNLYGKKGMYEVTKWDFTLWEKIKILFCSNPRVTVEVLVDGDWDTGTIKHATRRISHILLLYQVDRFDGDDLF